jgi:putative DNA primase/helicase
VLAVLYGIGRNGKSTLVEVFQDLLGDYSTTANANAIMQQAFSDSTAQYALAELKGVRFVSMSETKSQDVLEEATVKQITGSDTISARAPYGRPFTYRPEFKLWMSTNHRPNIADGSEAIWDRIRLIPFEQRFEGEDADPKLPEKLRKELPGILAWAVRGCVEWGKGGLGTAGAVEEATREYRDDMDFFAAFIAEECEEDPKGFAASRALHQAYRAWHLTSERESEDLSAKALGEKLRSRGHKPKKQNGVRGWSGVCLKGDEGPEGDDLSTDEKPHRYQEKSANSPSKSASVDRSDGNSQNFSLEEPRVGKFGKSASNPSNVSTGEELLAMIEEVPDAEEEGV